MVAPVSRPIIGLARLARARLTTVLIALVGVAGLLGGGWIWLRGSSLLAVRDVSVTGLSGRDAPRVRVALESAARGMTTVRVRRSDLRAAVAGYPLVKDLRVDADLPRTLRIRVIENRPVAALEAGARRVAVADDGTLLLDEVATGLPSVPVDTLPGGPRVTDPRRLSAIAVAAAAPDALRPLVRRVRRGTGGLRVELEGGVRVVFGSGARAAAKWAAAARLLADSRAAGSTYIDVRLPERPVAGGFGDAPIQTLPERQGEASPTSAGESPTPDPGGHSPST